MNRLRITALLLLPILLVGCQQGEVLDKLTRNMNLGDTLKSAQQAFGEVGPGEEEAIGREAVAVLLGAVPLLDNDPLQRYVNQVGGWVALHTERKELRWRFGVLDSEDINAFAAPGGYIFITKGLLRRMQSEAELAGALAHETVHVLKRHHLAAVQQAARVNLASSLIATQVREGDRASMEKFSAGFKELYARGLDKADEFEADRMGVVIATRAGYDPYGLPAVLQTLAGMNPNDASLAFLFKTHPPASQRLSLLERLFDQLDPYAAQPPLSKRFQQQLARLK
ncbi:MAG: M48 family metalloprotease [Gammaproteobacteria bacterium]|nr:M48 family metalloprotease [Gammaproteobacteria bacterium]